MDRYRHRPDPFLTHMENPSGQTHPVAAPHASPSRNSPDATQRARFIHQQLPPGGLFANQSWRIAPAPFPLSPNLVAELDSLGRVLLQFHRAVNLLYRHSVAGKQPAWIAQWLDQGKPPSLLTLQRDPAFKNDLPRVIRPDLLLTENGFAISELDSVPGGIGLTAWLNQTYSLGGANVLGGADGMLRGFAGIFPNRPQVHIVVADEAATYRPEMEWIAAQLDSPTQRFFVRNADPFSPADNDAVYRFFELFDLPNVPVANILFERARSRRIQLTPPPKTCFEEKSLFALLWNRHLHSFWREQLGERFLNRLLELVPYSWLLDPTPLPPHAAIPELNLTDWHQLKDLSQRQRELILKISGFSPDAWGARGVSLGSDLSSADWSAAVEQALDRFHHSPYILQRYAKPKSVQTSWFDPSRDQLNPMAGRVRLCPYYFVHGEGDLARAHLGGVLATICPADKKIIHGMTDAILAPCGPATTDPANPS
jgi:hypothetical protein